MDPAIKAARLADQMRDYLALWINQDFPQRFISVLQVSFNPARTESTVWLEFMVPEHEASVLPELEERSNYYKHRLQKSLGKRSMPRLFFVSQPPLVLDENK